jgi:hypothetical protein
MGRRKGGEEEEEEGGVRERETSKVVDIVCRKLPRLCWP